MTHNSLEIEVMDVISKTLEMCMVDEDICPTDVAM